MKSYKDLQVWQLSVDLVDEVYRMTAGFPTDERFGLTSQMQRAAVSIAANIAEGSARDSTREFLRHLSIARGSLAELTTYFVIAGRRRFIRPEPIDGMDDLAARVGRLLSGLQRSLRRKLGRNGRTTNR